MPVQALIRKLSRAQVDKAIIDSKTKINVKEQDGLLLLVVAASENGEAKDLAANAALQKICDADAAIMQKERDDAEAAERVKRSPG